VSLPTNRTRVDRPVKAEISPEHVALYRRIMRLPDGDKRRALELELHRSLHLPPWFPEVTEVHDGPPPWPAHTMGARLWAEGQALREQLDQLVAGAATTGQGPLSKFGQRCSGDAPGGPQKKPLKREEEDPKNSRKIPGDFQR
jgi:hypothetical protein